MPSQDVGELAALVAQEKAALEHNDWPAFTNARREADVLLGRLSPQQDDLPALRTVLEDLERVSAELATKHRITGALLRHFGKRHEAAGRLLNGKL